VTARFHGVVHRAQELRADTLLKLLQDADALRQPERFEHFLQACEADFCGRAGSSQEKFVQGDLLHQGLEVAAAVDAGAVAKQCADPGQIRDQVYQARLMALKQWQQRHHSS
jgi:tRNA nucleotidyltransferase (CCA-adding enzyme)